MRSLQFLQQEAVLLLQSIIAHPLLFLLPLLFTSFLTIWLFNNPRTNRTQPPSPLKFPVIGNLHQLGSLLHRSLQSLAQTHGPVMLLHLGRLPMIVISSAAAAQEIMKTHDIIFSNRPESSIAKRLLYDCKDVSTAPYGEYWRQMKSIYVLQLLSTKRVQSFRAVREEETALMVNRIAESSALDSLVNLSEMFVSLTNDVICRAAFGRKYGDGKTGEKFKRVLREFLELLSGFDFGRLSPWLAWVNRVNGLDAKVERVAKEIDEFLEGVVEERLNGFKGERDDGGGEVED